MDIRDELKSAIRAFMMENALGRENAIPRRILRDYLRRGLGYTLSDRTLRRLYAELPVGFSTSVPRGLYWISSKEDLRATVAEERAKGIACLTSARRKEEVVSEARQLSLGI
ncbi:MAG: hypothetical protein ABFC85_11520 [Rectinema sp.]